MRRKTLFPLLLLLLVPACAASLLLGVSGLSARELISVACDLRRALKRNGKALVRFLRTP